MFTAQPACTKLRVSAASRAACKRVQEASMDSDEHGGAPLAGHCRSPSSRRTAPSNARRRSQNAIRQAQTVRARTALCGAMRREHSPAVDDEPGGTHHGRPERAGGTKLGPHASTDITLLLETALTHTSYANESEAPRASTMSAWNFWATACCPSWWRTTCSTTGPPPRGRTAPDARRPCVRGRPVPVCPGDRAGAAICGCGRGEELGGGRNAPSVVSDAFEAVIAALYLDGGHGDGPHFHPALHHRGQDRRGQDYKTKLQEVIQQNPEEQPALRWWKGESGPDHDKRFRVAVYLNSNLHRPGRGPQQEIGRAGMPRGKRCKPHGPDPQDLIRPPHIREQYPVYAY